MKSQSHLLFILFLFSFLLLTSCTDEQLPTPVPTHEPIPTVSEISSSGRLAYLGGDGNVYVTTPDDDNSAIAVTNDAESPSEGAGLSYHRLSWAPDGQLAFAQVIRRGDDAQSKLYVTRAPSEPAYVVGENNNHFVIYIYWSPVPCAGRPTCRQLAYLIEEEEDIGLRLVEIEDNQPLFNERIGMGWPFYFSWAPDGRSILWHTDGAREENNAALLARYDVINKQLETLPQAPGKFLAPAWSPHEERWLAVTEEAPNDQLYSFSIDQKTTIATGQSGDISFVWSPDGKQIAYAIRRFDSHPFYGPIHIFDLQTQETRRITDLGFRILAFFWDPDGQRIGYLTWFPLRQEEWSQWRVYDLTIDRDRGLKQFHPTPKMRSAILSFNQYAQSHRFWSPDGRYLVYANRENNLMERVWLLDTWNEESIEPILVDEGSFAVWSWE